MHKKLPLNTRTHQVYHKQCARARKSVLHLVHPHLQWHTCILYKCSNREFGMVIRKGKLSRDWGHCQHCGKYIDSPSSKYCESCGKKLDRALWWFYKLHCASCGRFVTLEEPGSTSKDIPKYCKECGAKLR